MKNVKGIVASVNGCNVKVKYSRTVINKKYSKTLHKDAFIKAHTNFDVKEGEVVFARSCAPISKTKKYILIKEEK